jgi:hypothetical protein
MLKTIANHSDLLLKLDLQLFGEDDDVILPDDYQEDTEDSIEPNEAEQTDDVEPVEDTTETEQNESEPIEAPELFKLQYNKEEMEIPLEEARALAQKGMNYEKAVERAKQEARDSYIAEQGFEWNGKPITTEAEYKQALQEREWMEQYQNQDLPDEVVQELIEGRKFRESFQEQQKAKEVEQKQQAEAMEFFEYFNQVNGRAYQPGDLPSEVTQMAEEMNIPIKFAYMQYHTQQLQNQLKVLKQNESNAKRAPIGGVSTHGSNENESEDDFLAGFNSI